MSAGDQLEPFRGAIVYMSPKGRLSTARDPWMTPQAHAQAEWQLVRSRAKVVCVKFRGGRECGRFIPGSLSMLVMITKSQTSCIHAY